MKPKVTLPLLHIRCMKQVQENTYTHADVPRVKYGCVPAARWLYVCTVITYVRVTLWNGHPKFLTSSEFYLRLPLVLDHSCLRTCLALRCKTTILETWPKISPPSSHNVSSFFLGHRKSHSESRLLMETGYWTGLLWQRFTVWIMITFKIIFCYKIWLVSFCCPYYSL